MKQNKFEELFLNSFDTFRVFDSLTMQETGRILQAAPKTIWQIINHLTIWQDHQLAQLMGSANAVEADEQMTWVEEEQCHSQEDLDQAIVKFHHQLDQIREEILRFDCQDAALHAKFKIAQDTALHLSFHVGEIILMRRMTGNYPLPHEMEDFLG